MLRARTSFHAEGERLVAKDQLVHDHDEIVAGREHLFDKVADGDKVEKPRRRSPSGSSKPAG